LSRSQPAGRRRPATNLLKLGREQLAASHRGLQRLQLGLALLQLPLLGFEAGPLRLDLLGAILWHQQGVAAAEIGQLLLDRPHPRLSPGACSSRKVRPWLSFSWRCRSE
jgi:hypothetical protein